MTIAQLRARAERADRQLRHAAERDGAGYTLRRSPLVYERYADLCWAAHDSAVQEERLAWASAEAEARESRRYGLL